MLRITPRFGPYKQKGGSEVEQAENRSRAELRQTCHPPSRAPLGLLGATAGLCTVWPSLRKKCFELGFWTDLDSG